MGKGLIDTLYEQCTGYLELRAFHPKLKGQKGGIRKIFAKLSDLESINLFIKHNMDCDLYFGVSTRDGKGGGKDNVVEIPAVFIDIDFKQVDEREALKLLNEFPLQPTIIVKSGGGLHCYWKLTEPSTLDDIQKIEEILYGLAAALKGDFASAEAARILRVPNTYNHKYDPPRKVELIYCNGSCYNPSDFDFLPSRERAADQQPVTGSHETIEKIMQCAFMQHCELNARALEEPAWYAMVTQLAKEPGGVSMIHRLSKPYPKYSAKETDAKILHAINSTGPHSCESIRKHWDCEKDCGVKSPAALAFRKPVDDSWPRDTSDTSDTSDTCDTSDTSDTCDPILIPVIPNDTSVIPVIPNHDTSVIPAAKPPILSDADKVREWLNITDGVFHYTELARDLKISNIKNIKNILSRLCKESIIERIGSRSGTYQIVDTSFNRIELFSTQPDEYDFHLPMGLSSLAVLEPGNLVVVAGDTNAAKTAFLLEACRLNIKTHKLRYINSEMSTAELNNRLRRYQHLMDVNEWHRVEFGTITGNFHHHVAPDDVTVIDYIDIHEEFYRLGGIFMKIHERLKNGICLAAIQKRSGSVVGKGGDATMEKCRLYVTLNRIEPANSEPYMIARIAKCKQSRREDQNANGLIRSFIVKHRGTEFDFLDNWHRPAEHEKRLLAGRT